MPIYARQKKGKDSYYYLFNLPIYTIQYMKEGTADLYKKCFLFELFTAKKYQDVLTSVSVREIKLAGLPLLHYGYAKQVYRVRILGCTCYRVSVFTLFYRHIKKYLAPQTKHVFVLNAHLGENYCLLTYAMKTLLDKTPGPVQLLVVYPYVVPLVQMIFPTLPVACVGDLESSFDDRSISLHGVTFTFFFTQKHFAQVEKGVLEHTTHFFDALLTYAGVSRPQLVFTPMRPSSASVHRAEQILDQLGLAEAPFVVIAPEARTCQLLPADFWANLVEYIQQAGVTVLWNAKKTQGPAGTKSIFLPLDEMFTVVQRAKGLIALRSGLNEVFLQTGTPLHVIYSSFLQSKFGEIPAQDMAQGFGLASLPQQDVAQVYSYIFTQNSSSLLAQLKANLKF